MFHVNTMQSEQWRESLTKQDRARRKSEKRQSKMRLSDGDRASRQRASTRTLAELWAEKAEEERARQEAEARERARQEAIERKKQEEVEAAFLRRVQQEEQRQQREAERAAQQEAALQRRKAEEEAERLRRQPKYRKSIATSFDAARLGSVAQLRENDDDRPPAAGLDESSASSRFDELAKPIPRDTSSFENKTTNRLGATYRADHSPDRLDSFRPKPARSTTNYYEVGEPTPSPHPRIGASPPAAAYPPSTAESRASHRPWHSDETRRLPSHKRPKPRRGTVKNKMGSFGASDVRTQHGFREWAPPAVCVVSWDPFQHAKAEVPTWSTHKGRGGGRQQVDKRGEGALRRARSAMDGESQRQMVEWAKKERAKTPEGHGLPLAGRAATPLDPVGADAVLGSAPLNRLGTPCVLHTADPAERLRQPTPELPPTPDRSGRTPDRATATSSPYGDRPPSTDPLDAWNYAVTPPSTGTTMRSRPATQERGFSPSSTLRSRSRPATQDSLGGTRKLDAQLEDMIEQKELQILDLHERLDATVQRATVPWPWADVDSGPQLAPRY